MLAWWNFLVTLRNFSSSFFDSVSSIRASTSECRNASAYCGSPMSGNHSDATHLNKHANVNEKRWNLTRACRRLVELTCVPIARLSDIARALAASVPRWPIEFSCDASDASSPIQSPARHRSIPAELCRSSRSPRIVHCTAACLVPLRSKPTLVRRASVRSAYPMPRAIIAAFPRRSPRSTGTTACCMRPIRHSLIVLWDACCDSWTARRREICCPRCRRCRWIDGSSGCLASKCPIWSMEFVVAPFAGASDKTDRFRSRRVSRSARQSAIMRRCPPTDWKRPHWAVKGLGCVPSGCHHLQTNKQKILMWKKPFDAFVRKCHSYIDTCDDWRLTIYCPSQLWCTGRRYHMAHRSSSSRLQRFRDRCFRASRNQRCTSHGRQRSNWPCRWCRNQRSTVHPSGSSFPTVVSMGRTTTRSPGLTCIRIVDGEPEAETNESNTVHTNPIMLHAECYTSCNCSCTLFSCMSRVFNWAASAIDLSASSRACFISDQRSRSRSDVCLVTFDSFSRIRCSKLRMKSRSSCSLSCNEAHSCFTCASRSTLSVFSLRRSFLKSKRKRNKDAVNNKNSKTIQQPMLLTWNLLSCWLQLSIHSIAADRPAAICRTSADAIWVRHIDAANSAVRWVLQKRSQPANFRLQTFIFQPQTLVLRWICTTTTK